MARITEYTSITSPEDSDMFVLDGDNGTRSIAYLDLVTDILSNVTISDTTDTESNLFDLLNDYPYMHRNVYRGDYLGDSVTSSQIYTISEGTFDDIFVGDYWTIDSVNWIVADLDYWLYYGDESFTDHHAVIIPEPILYSAEMNATNTTSGGYLGSEMYTTNLDDARNQIEECFGDYVLTHREFFTNTVGTYYASGGEWTDSTVDLMNENMVYGSGIQRVHNDTSSAVPNNYTIDNSQLALFRLNRTLIQSHRTTWWLRDVVSASSFAYVSSYGRAGIYYASNSGGVRPAFAIGQS